MLKFLQIAKNVKGFIQKSEFKKLIEVNLIVFCFIFLISCKINFRQNSKTKAIYSMHNLDESKNSSSIDYQINDIFKQLDKETDNLITISEFVEGCLKDDFLLYFLNPTIWVVGRWSEKRERKRDVKYEYENYSSLILKLKCFFLIQIQIKVQFNIIVLFSLKIFRNSIDPQCNRMTPILFK